MAPLSNVVTWLLTRRKRAITEDANEIANRSAWSKAYGGLLDNLREQQEHITDLASRVGRQEEATILCMQERSKDLAIMASLQDEVRILKDKLKIAGE